MSHTPGPWKYQSEMEGDRITHRVYTASGKFGHPASCQNEDDAKLVSAAPELLEAAKKILEAIHEPEPEWCSEWDQLKSAIAKAKGGKS